MRYLHEARETSKASWKRAAAGQSVKLVANFVPPKDVELVNESDNGAQWPFSSPQRYVVPRDSAISRATQRRRNQEREKTRIARQSAILKVPIPIARKRSGSLNLSLPLRNCRYVVSRVVRSAVAIN